MGMSWEEFSRVLDKHERWIAEMREHVQQAQRLVTDLSVEQQRAVVFEQLDSYLAALTHYHLQQESPEAYDAMQRVQTRRAVDVAEKALRSAAEELHRRDVELYTLRRLLSPTGDAFASVRQNK